MANTPGSDNPFPSVLFAEHVDPATPGTDTHRLFVDTDGLLKKIDDAAAVVTYPTSAGSGTLTTVEEVDGSPTNSAITKLVLPNGTLGIVGTVATYTPAGGGGNPNCYQSILTTPVTIVNANTFYDGPSITPAAGDYLVTFEVDISQTHASGTNHTARVIHNGTVQKARNAISGAGGGNASSLSVNVRMTADGTNPIIGQAAANRGSSDSVILDTANVNGTTDKCTSITAVRITSI